MNTNTEMQWPASEELFFLGRNGGGKCCGISVLPHYNNAVLLEPLTSRGKPARCSITVPKDKINGLIAMLQQVRDS